MLFFDDGSDDELALRRARRAVAEFDVDAEVNRLAVQSTAGPRRFDSMVQLLPAYVDVTWNSDAPKVRSGSRRSWRGHTNRGTIRNWFATALTKNLSTSRRLRLGR